MACEDVSFGMLFCHRWRDGEDWGWVCCSSVFFLDISGLFVQDC